MAFLRFTALVWTFLSILPLKYIEESMLRDYSRPDPIHISFLFALLFIKFECITVYQFINPRI